MGGLQLLFPVLLGGLLFLGTAGRACEKHLDGHGNGSETQAELQQR